MQTKKRAKPVKFGKKVKDADEKKYEAPSEESHTQSSHKKEPEVEATITVTETSLAATIDEKAPPEEVSNEDEAHEQKEEIILEEEKDEAPTSENSDESKAAFARGSSEPKPDEEIAPVDESEKEDQEKEDESKDDESYLSEAKTAFSNAAFEAEGNKKKSFFVSFLIIAILAFLVGLGGILGVNYLIQNGNFSLGSLSQSLPWMNESTPTPTPEPTKEPTPTEAPVDLSAYSIEVQNGSGVSGAAGKLQEALVSDGFTVSGVGNADNSDYTATEISVREGIEDAYVQKLRESLEKTYTVSDTIQAPASQKADVVVILGKDTK